MRIFWLGLAGLLVLTAAAAFIYTGLWHTILVWMWRMPMLSWLPLLAAVIAGIAIGRLTGRRMHAGATVMVALMLLFVGTMETLFFKTNGLAGDFEYMAVTSLPERTQPRLLPRAGVADDPQFADAKEIHLARDPGSGSLIWTGEWDASTFGGASGGVAVKQLDVILDAGSVVRLGFDHSVAGLGPGTFKWKSKLKHPLSRIQYPVIVPASRTEAVAVAPYMGYRGFPFRRPYLKGVLVYHQDGRLEDLTPEQAAARPELARTGRIFPELLARKQAEALARGDELNGEIVDGEGNRQPFLTALDADRTVWVTVVNDDRRTRKVKAIVLANSTTGETSVWKPPADQPLLSTRDVVQQARSLPLRWKERRCCDSDGHSYTVTLRKVVEPRLAFKDGRPYYMVSVVPTRELSLPRQIEFTLLIDARTGQKLDEFKHVAGGTAEDERLQEFFLGD